MVTKAEARDPDQGPSVDPAWRTGAKLIALAAAIAALWLAREIVLLAFLGILIGIVLSFPVDWLARHMKRGVAVLIVVLVILGGIGGAVAVGAAKLVSQADTLRDEAQKGLRSLQEKFEQLRSGGQKQQKPKGQQQQAVPPPEAVAEQAIKGVLGVFSALTAAVLVLVLGLFLVNEPEVYMRGLRALVPRRYQEVFDTSFAETAQGLRKWVGGILVSMTIMGALTTVGLAVAGIKGWLVLGILTFFATFVPYVGAIASAIPGLLVAAAQDTTHLLYAAAVYVGVHIVEGYLVEPLVMKRAVKLQPALLLVWQGFFSAVFGLVGAVVATPVLVCVQILTARLWVERRLGNRP
ncbi:MAG TPA: AI-2E family transporter [Myxococcales bacterium]|nr:AI-2E family transporter [Myxococcales bacterium]